MSLNEAFKLLIDHAGKSYAELAIGMLTIVKALKSQPNFDVANFEQRMREAA